MHDSLTGLLQKPLKLNSAVMIIGFLLVVIALQFLQIFSQNKQLSLLRIGNLKAQNRITELSQELAREKSANVSPVATVSFDANSSTRVGWVRYSNTKLGLSFEYPLNAVQLQEQNQVEEEKENITISLFSKKTTDLEGRPVPLLQFSNRYAPMTYGDIYTPDSVAVGGLSLNGSKYDVLNFVMGEGSPCGGSSIKTALTELKQDLMLYKLEIEQQRNKDRENCSGDEYDQFKTSPQDMQLVDAILNTFVFEQ